MFQAGVTGTIIRQGGERFFNCLDLAVRQRSSYMWFPVKRPTLTGKLAGATHATVICYEISGVLNH